MNTKTNLIRKAERLLEKSGKVDAVGKFFHTSHGIDGEEEISFIFDMGVIVKEGEDRKIKYFIDFVSDEISEETAKINQYKDMYCTEHNLGLIRIPKNIARLTTKLVVFE